MTEEKKETARPGAGLYFFVAGLLLFVIVVKIVSCTVFSKVDVMEEIRKAQNPPSVHLNP
ncbi:MAG: hypothetical protein K6C40_05170 [Thermoguttaceae bacterium]|nr:hypothetical protein [Thermoguttaceae bacterium]